MLNWFYMPNHEERSSEDIRAWEITHDPIARRRKLANRTIIALSVLLLATLIWLSESRGEQTRMNCRGTFCCPSPKRPIYSIDGWACLNLDKNHSN